MSSIEKEKKVNILCIHRDADVKIINISNR